MPEMAGPEIRLLEQLLFRIDAERAKEGIGLPPDAGIQGTSNAMQEMLRRSTPTFPDKASTSPVQVDNQVIDPILDFITQSGVLNR